MKLLDFGIAKRDQHKVTSAATTTGAVVGTPYYMSPEQIVGDKDTDARTDIWSLGVVAYEAMTGRRPFEGSTVGAITLAIHTATRRITDHIPNAPVALDEWFAKACARDVKERFQTPREASQALLVATGDLAPSLPLLRAPMASMVGDGSDPSLSGAISGEPPSDGRAATHLSSVFPLPSSRPSRTRPVLVIGAVAVALVVVAGMFVVPAMLKPRVNQALNGTANPTFGSTSPSANAAPTASDENGAAIWPATGTTAGATSAATAATAAAGATSATPTAASSTPPAVVVTSRPAGPSPQAGSTGRPGTRPTTTTTSKPTKPGRTRDDDDIK